MKYGIGFGLVAVGLAALALMHRGWQLCLLWPALSFGLVALGYLGCGPRVYGKTPRGVLAPWARLVLLPFLLFRSLGWRVVRLVEREPPLVQLTERIYIGRRLRPGELPGHIDHVIDLTCEFDEPAELRQRSYHLFPILDGSAPWPAELRRWAAQAARLPGKVYIHCAAGHGRTGLFAAALLLELGQFRKAEEALEFIRSKRPGVRLGRQQLRVLRAVQNGVERRVAELLPGK